MKPLKFDVKKIIGGLPALRFTYTNSKNQENYVLLIVMEKKHEVKLKRFGIYLSNTKNLMNTKVVSFMKAHDEYDHVMNYSATENRAVINRYDKAYNKLRPWLADAYQKMQGADKADIPSNKR